MRILILDDMKIRHNTFARIYKDHTVVSVYRYSEFLKQLESSPWDLIHLDHDLGDFVSEPDTFVDGWGSVRLFDGQHASLRVAELSDELKPKQVIIHSINSSGALAMKAIIERAKIPVTYEPFNHKDASIDDPIIFSSEQERQISEWAKKLK